jgi:hypothetical protein
MSQGRNLCLSVCTYLSRNNVFVGERNRRLSKHGRSLHLAHLPSNRQRGEVGRRNQATEGKTKPFRRPHQPVSQLSLPLCRSENWRPARMTADALRWQRRCTTPAHLENALACKRRFAPELRGGHARQVAARTPIEQAPRFVWRWPRLRCSQPGAIARGVG